MNQFGLETSKPAVRPGFHLDEEGVILDASRDKIHTLNATAAYIWSLSDGSRTVAEIAQELSGLCSEPFDSVLRDVSKIVRSFEREGLVLCDHESP